MATSKITPSKNRKLLLHKRGHIRGSITKMYDDIANYINLNEDERLFKKDKVVELKASLLDLDTKYQKQLFESDSSDQEIEGEFDACELYQDRIRGLLYALKDSNIDPSSSPVSDVTRSLLKSPTAPLPKFRSQQGENLETFLLSFEETLSKFKYTEYDKLLLLKQQVEGKGSFLLDSLEHNKQTYSEAKNLLISAFASIDIQKFNVIFQLSQMKLSYETEPFKYISDMRKIQQSFSSLKVEVDDLLRYFFFTGMNQTFKSQLVLITNHARPTLDEIFEHFFDANERYLVSQKIFKDRKKSSTYEHGTTTMALSAEINNSNPFVNCTLCSDTSNSKHPINKCSKFPTPSEKLAKLRSLNACEKCSWLNHKTNSCRFKFRECCRQCRKWHFSFLCVNPKISAKPLLEENSQSSVAIVTNALKGSSSADSVLSTFSCKFKNGRRLRGLRDSGSQSNLITESALADYNYKLLKDNVSLTIKGINNQKTYCSKHVLIEILIGDTFKLIEALTLPEISISMSLPGLSKVVDAFVDNGYKLADQSLLMKTDCINNIDIILGANAAHCFHDQTFTFGPSECSIFLSTQLGVMLIGNLTQMINDLPYLPKYDIPASCDQSNQYIDHTLSLFNVNHISSSVTFADLSDKNDYALSNECIVSRNLDKALGEVLEEQCDLYLSKTVNIDDGENSDHNNEMVQFLLDNASRKTDGRIKMPLLWNSKVHHLLGNNFNLAKKVLMSNKKKLVESPQNLILLNNSLKELLDIGAIEKINNLEDYKNEFPNHSFMAHMPIIKLGRESTKCRLVFLSNLCDKYENNVISHNQAMLSGPCLNQKLSVALVHLRFGLKLLCFDLRKAFLQIELSELDQSQLLFLWFRDPINGDFDIEVFKNVRLSFGLRCSPTILMVSLYKILIVDAVNDSEDLKALKKHIYSLIYMDNGSICTDSSEELEWAYNQLNNIFNPYKFELQQYCTNDIKLQRKLPESEKGASDDTELFGLIWNKCEDTLSTKKKCLNDTANTKRKILKSIAENFDPYNFDGPIMNRARLFMHKLQLCKTMNWDTILPKEDCKEWINICSQVNSAKPMKISRFVGSRKDSFDLMAFCDSSKVLYGTAIFIQNRNTKQVHFVMAKNRMVSKQLDSKSIPSLELLSVVLGTETLIDLKHELCGPLCMDPITISNLFVYSDSLVALHWINSHFLKLDKMNKQSVFVMNRLQHLQKLTDKSSITFSFVDGISNPADFITRPISYKILIKTNYLTGPSFLKDQHPEISRADILTFTVPYTNGVTTNSMIGVSKQIHASDPVLDSSRFSNLSSLVAVYSRVLMFVYKLKSKIVKSFTFEEIDLKSKALEVIIKQEQYLHYPEVFSFFSKSKFNRDEIPNVVNQMNIFIDTKGVLRVGSKLIKNKTFKSDSHCPILLPKAGHVTELIVKQAHVKLSHAGIYSMLSELRKKFWIPHYYSGVKKVLRNCIHCKRFKQRTIKLNQSPYRDFRWNPSNVPFSDVFIDHIGPFYTKNVNVPNNKTYIFCVTCLWTRAVNLIVSTDLATEEFLRALQMHIFAYGVPQRVYSDLGTQIVSGSNIVSNFLNDHKTHNFFKENNMKLPEFKQYFKGNSELGSLVESLVKQTKRLIFGSIKKTILSFRDFEFIVAQTISLINKRPIAFKECLRGDIVDTLPQAITPETLLFGHPLPSVNIIPFLQTVANDPDWTPTSDPVDKIRATYQKLRKVRSELVEAYNSDFLTNLIYQAINIKDRYEPVGHYPLQVNDVVLMKEQHTKPSHYPMAIVKEVTTNDLGETTGAILLKGNTREVVKRHSTCLIPLLRPKKSIDRQTEEPTPHVKRCPKLKRRAFLESEIKTRKLFN